MLMDAFGYCQRSPVTPFSFQRGGVADGVLGYAPAAQLGRSAQAVLNSVCLYLDRVIGLSGMHGIVL